MAENEKAGNNGQQDFTKFLILTISSIVIMFVVFAGVNYVVMENLITQKIGSLNTSQEELGEEGGDEDQIQKGIIVDLGDFILNLCDESQMVENPLSKLLLSQKFIEGDKIKIDVKDDEIVFERA